MRILTIALMRWLCHKVRHRAPAPASTPFTYTQIISRNRD